MAPKQRKQEQRLPSFVRKVNVFFRRTKRGEVLTFLLFVVLAASFWVVQTSREENVAEYTVVFDIEAQPQDVVFTTHVPQQLKVTLSDTNTRLLNYSYNKRMDSLTVNFERYADAVGNFRISAAELQSLLSEELEASTRIVAVSPSLIDARFAQTEGRKFPVRVTGQYSAADNYRMRPLEVYPDSVIINAPTSVLDTLKYVPTVMSQHTEMRDSLLETLGLELSVGVKATPSRVNVLVPVAQYVEKVFDRIEVKVRDVPRDKRLVIFPYCVRLTCLVDFTSYRDVTEKDFLVSVSYDSIATMKSPDRLPINVSYLGPKDVTTNISISTTQAEYVVEQQ